MPIKNIIRQSVFFKPVAAWRETKAVRAWVASGCSTVPPSVVKRYVLKQFIQRFGLNTLVETGTYLGDTIAFFRETCKRIVSIELSPRFARAAQQRFRSSKHITILEGDSGQLIGEVLKSIDAPALFWLDGHYSGDMTAKGDSETPILRELESIFAHSIRGHVILIDDARLFDGTRDYPTMDALREFARAQRPDLLFAVENDMIRIHAAK